MAFKDITTKEELKEYLCTQLKESSTGDTCFSHYTSLDSAIKIFKNRTLRFSKLSKMNDVLERSWAGIEVANEYYFCLAQGKESFGMWAMYGGLKSNKKNNEGEKYVKMEIPRKSLASLCGSRADCTISSKKIIYTELLANKDNASFVPEKISISDGTENKNKIPISKKDFAGFVKDSVWIYEREIRLCAVPHEKANEDTFDVKLDDSFLDSIKIVPSPIANFEICRSKFCEELKNEDYKNNFSPNAFKDYFYIDDKDSQGAIK